MIQHKSTAILLAVLIAVSVFATGFVGGVPTAGDRGSVHSLTASNTTAENLTVEHTTVTTGSNEYTSSMPGFRPSQNLTLDAGANYRFFLTNENTGESVAIAANESGTVAADSFIFPLVYDGDGSVSQNVILWSRTSGFLNATVVNGSVPAASGLTNFSLALLGSSGETLAQVNAGHVVGYEGTVSQNSTSGSIELSVPRDAVPRTADVRLQLADNRSALHGPTAITRTMTYDSSTDAFTAVVDASLLGTGNNSWSAYFDWQGDQILDMQGTGGDGVAVSDATNGVNVKLSPSNPSVETNGTATYDVVVENIDAGVGSIGYDVTVGNTTVGTVESVSVNSGFPSTFTTTELASNGSTVSVQVAGGDTAGTGPVTVGNVTLRGHAVGTATVDLSVDSVGDENGSAYTVAGSQDATLTVQNETDGPVVLSDPATDGDGQFAGDGLYQDVNGDGSVTLADVTTIFNNFNKASVQGADGFDFNGDGSITLADVTTLFKQASA